MDITTALLNTALGSSLVNGELATTIGALAGLLSA